MGIAVSPQIHPQVAEFIDQPRKMLINGRWVNAASGKTFPTYNPATGEILAHVAEERPSHSEVEPGSSHEADAGRTPAPV